MACNDNGGIDCSTCFQLGCACYMENGTAFCCDRPKQL